MKIKSLIKHIVHPSSSFSSSSSSSSLSNNDQIMPRYYTRLLLFYEKGQGVASPLLKRSLSHALAFFPPLAGRFRERSDGGVDIQCSDGGVEFWEASAEGRLREFGDFQPNADFLQLSPVTFRSSISETPILLIQVTEFECGGVALLIGMHHHAGDGLSLMHFITTWTEIATGKQVSLIPSLDRTPLKARDPATPMFQHVEYRLGIPTIPDFRPPMTAKNFTFNAEHIQILKQKAGEGVSFAPTKYEAVASYLWRSITKARDLASSQVIKVGMAVDGRNRFNPPLPDGYFGNVNFYGCAISEAGKLIQQPLSYATSCIHDAVKRIDDKYMRSALDWVEQQDSPLSILPGFCSCLGVDLGMTSWIRFPLYEFDFGWGRPVFATIPVAAVDGLIVLLPSSTEGAINASIGLLEQHMAKLEQEIELFYETLGGADRSGGDPRS
ncbi:hypothetical protein O6H91_20G030800 [Diphasiastrum complanatum]|uniref:Uncharacterized protein n=1 Tax=Diphasiastrum complanatum TaxID=34168 RepID=A0ACC2AP48_DIPCM|nr:hypothetical protein O6H91_20G030800 [Diphasiastrum complanatum]